MTHSDDPDYQNVTQHLEVDRMQKLARVWFDHNPQKFGRCGLEDRHQQKVLTPVSPGKVG